MHIRADNKRLNLMKSLTQVKIILILALFLPVLAGCEYITNIFFKDKKAEQIEPMQPDAKSANNAYMEYRKALEANDIESIKRFVVKEKAKELEGEQASQMLDILRSFYPDQTSVTDTSISEDKAKAVLALQGEVEEGLMKGEVHLLWEDERWKLFNENWDMKIHPRPIVLQGGEAAPSFEPIDAALASPHQLYGMTKAEVFIKDGAEPPSEQFTLKGHEGEVTGLVFTPDGRFLISSSYGDFTIRIWDIQNRLEVQMVKSKRRPLGLDISPDGQTIITTDAYENITFWPFVYNRIEEPQEISAKAGHVSSAAISLNGSLFATASFDKFINIGNAVERTVLRKIDTPEPMRSIAFSPSGELLAAGATTNKFTLWNLREGKGRTYTISRVDRNSDVRSIVFSLNGRYLATGHMDSSITIWDVEKQKELHNFFVPNASTWAVRFSPDGKILATAHHDKSIYLWDVKTAKRLAVLSGHAGAPRSLAFSPDGKTFASGGEDNNIIIWQ